MKAWLQVRKPGTSFDILFNILGRKLQALCISIEEYLLYEQIHKGMEITRKDFQQVAKILFEVSDEATCNEMFNWMDIDKGEMLSADEIINSI